MTSCPQWFVGMLLAAFFSSSVRASSQETAASPLSEEPNGVLSVRRKDKESLRVDLFQHLESGEGVFASHNSKLYRSSPDDHYLPLFVYRGSHRFAILDLNLETGVITRHQVSDDLYCLPEKIKWLTSSRFVASTNPPFGVHVFHDIETGATKILEDSEFLQWDTKGENYVSLFNKKDWYERRTITRTFAVEQLMVSDALRYNDYWVYPLPLRGFINREEHSAWDKEIEVREIGKGAMEEPMVRRRGVALDRNHQISRAAFIGETTWVGFFEQVFVLGKYNNVLETNAVILDAHSVSENPPLQKHVSVRKRSVPFRIVPTSQAQYVDLSVNLAAEWNKETSCLELWKSRGVYFDEKPRRKLGQIPIALDSMTLADFSETTPGQAMPWSGFVTENE